MEKKELIQNIKKILSVYGCFNIAELDQYDNTPCVATMGNFVALADYYTEDYVDVSVYNPRSVSSDPIDEYEEQYDNLSEEVLQEILVLCEQWEAQSLQTEKRIANENF